MSEEIALAQADMQEIARLRAELAAANDRATAAQHALDSARAYADEVEQECVELRDRALGILRAARLLVAAWREERGKAEKWRAEVGRWATMVARQGNTAEHSALIQAAQRGGVKLWYSQEDEAYIAVFPSEPTISGIGDTPALALVELLIATRMGLESAREYADDVEQECANFRDKFLDVARKNAELHTETAPALLDARREWAGAVLDNLRLRRAARLLVAAWREERQAAAYWAGAVDLYRVALERATAPRNDDAAE